jgi:hypothetical protein
MKKLFFLIVFLCVFASLRDAYSQYIDTVNWALAWNPDIAKWSMLTNRTTYKGIAAGKFWMPLVMNASSIDSTKWNFKSNPSNAKYSFVTNKEVFYGKDSGMVQVTLAYVINEFDTTGLATRTYVNSLIDTLPKLSEDNVWIGGNEFQSFFKVHSRTISPTSNDTLLVTDVIVYVNVSGGVNIILPNPADFTDRLLIVKDINFGFELYPHLSETIDGQASLSFASYESYILTSNGTNWFILSKK